MPFAVNLSNHGQNLRDSHSWFDKLTTHGC